MLKMRRETGMAAYAQILDTQTQIEIPCDSYCFVWTETGVSLSVLIYKREL